MKQIFFRKELILLVCTIIFMSCSKEEETIAVESKNFEEAQFFERNSGEVYDDFEEFFSTLYGSNFEVLNTVKYEEEDGDYFVTEVTVGGVLDGYFVELSDSNVVYLDHDSANGLLDYYDYEDNEMLHFNYDLTKDSLYLIKGFSPEEPQVQGSRRFFGWTKPGDTNWGPCAPDGLQYATVTYYAFWLENGTKVITRPCQ